MRATNRNDIGGLASARWARCLQGRDRVALPVLAFAFFALHVVARQQSFAVFEVVMLATPFVCFVVSIAVVVDVVVRGRWRHGHAGVGAIVIAIGAAIELHRLIAWSALFADHMNQWDKYRAPPRPFGVAVSMPFLVAGVFAIRHVVGQRWRFTRRVTALLIVALVITGLWAVGNTVLADIAISGDDARSALPALSCVMLALAASTVLGQILLSGFVDDRVPCGIVVRCDAR